MTGTAVRATPFVKGNKLGRGRPPNSPNKVPKLLKDAIMMAAELEGSNQHGKDKLIGFLRYVAREDLRSFCGLLGRVLPLQIESRHETTVDVTYQSVAEVRRELASRGISMEVIAKIITYDPIVDAEVVDETPGG